jgi:hypothetical protein
MPLPEDAPGSPKKPGTPPPVGFVLFAKIPKAAYRSSFKSFLISIAQQCKFFHKKVGTPHSGHPGWIFTTSKPCDIFAHVI